MNLADVLRWAFTSNVTHVQSTTVPELEPWATPFWKMLASLFVFTAAAHGLHGVLSVLDDYFAQPRARLTLPCHYHDLASGLECDRYLRHLDFIGRCQ